jgi:hypothetical protein
MKAVITRQIANDISKGLKTRGFSELEIQERLKGRDFDQFAHRVLSSPRLERSLDRLIDRIMAPGVLEAAFAKARQKRQEEARNQLLMAVEEMMKNRKRLQGEEAERKVPSFWDRLWARLKKDLIG